MESLVCLPRRRDVDMTTMMQIFCRYSTVAVQTFVLDQMSQVTCIESRTIPVMSAI